MLVADLRAAAVLDVIEALRTAGGRAVGLVGHPGSGRSSVVAQVLRDAPVSLLIDVAALVDPVCDEPTVDTRSVGAGLRDLIATGVLGQMLQVPSSRLSAVLAGGPEARPATVALRLWQASQATTRRAASGLELVVIDDFDLLDDFSRAVVGRLATLMSTRGARVLLVVSVRSGSELPAQVRWVELLPPSTAEVRRLAESSTGFPVPWRVADRLTIASGGDLRAVQSIVAMLVPDALRGVQLLPQPLPLDTRVARTILAPIPVDSPVTDVLAALALQPQLPQKILDHFPGADRGAGAGAIAVSAGRVTAVAPAAAVAAWTLCSPERRTAVRAAVAGVLPPGRAVVYRDSAIGRADLQPGSTKGWGSIEVSGSTKAVCAEVARSLTLGDAPTVSLGLDRLGHRLPANGEAVAAGLFREGYFTDLVQCLTNATQRPGGLPVEVVERWSGELNVLHGRAHQRVPEVGPLPAGADEHQRVLWVESMVAACRGFWHRDQYDDAADCLQRIAGLDSRLGPEQQTLVALAAAELALKRRDPGAAAELSRAARDWARRKSPGYDVGASVTVYLLLSVGDLPTAATVLRAAQPSRGSGALSETAHLVSRVQLEVASTRYQAADSLLAEADLIMPISSGGSAHLWSPEIEVATALGETPKRSERSWRVGGDSSLQLPAGARADGLAVSGRRALVQGRFAEAAVLLQQALAPGGLMFEPRTAVLADLLEAERESGAADARMQELLDRYAEWLPDRDSGRFPSLMGRCRALVADPAAARPLFLQAADATAVDFPIDRARALVAGARRIARQPDGQEVAITWLNQALAILDSQGLTGWCEHARVLRRSIDPDAGRELTALEREITRLVLHGRSNADIARALFMSKRSLELQLTRIYRALGVRGKSQLRSRHQNGSLSA